MAETGGNNREGINADRIHIIRAGIKARIPEAEGILRKSGLTPRNKRFGRAAINIAADKLRHEEAAGRDQLTDLYNLKGFTDRLNQDVERTRRQNTSMGLLTFDANGLKTINDTYGHEAGNRFLREIADVLREDTRDIDTVARTGGDEYWVILSNTTSEGVKDWWKRVSPLFSERRISIGGGAVVLTGAEIRNAKNIQELITEKKHQADQYMYVAKTLSKERGTSLLKTEIELLK